MIPLFNKLFENEDYKRLSKNVISLFSLQSLNYILPILTFPYLTRVLGPEKFGLIAFATAFISYFQIITDYGFNLSATKNISINRHSNDILSEIFSTVMVCKLLLMIFSFILMLIIICIFDKFRINYILYLLTFGLVIGNFLFPTWFFQGMEKMKYISFLNIFNTLFFTLMIFLFVNNSSDYLIVPLITSIGSIFIGLVSLRIIIKKFEIKFRLPNKSKILHQFKEGFHLFISILAISVYSVSNTFILGIFVNNVIVSYYAVAEKIIRMSVSLFDPIFRSTYPYLGLLVHQSRKEALKFLKKLTIFVVIVGTILSVVLLLFGNIIIEILAGHNYQQSIFLIQIMAFLVLIIPLSNVFGNQTMINFNFKRAVSKIYVFVAIINLILILLLIPVFSSIGAAISLVISETIVTIIMIVFVKKYIIQ